MEPIQTENTNLILKAPEGMEDRVIDLPCTRIVFGDGIQGVESCWQPTEEEIAEIIKTKRVYFYCMGDTHPPISISAYSTLSGQVEGQYDTGNDPNETGKIITETEGGRY